MNIDIRVILHRLNKRRTQSNGLSESYWHSHDSLPQQQNKAEAALNKIKRINIVTLTLNTTATNKSGFDNHRQRREDMPVRERGCSKYSYDHDH